MIGFCNVRAKKVQNHVKYSKNQKHIKSAFICQPSKISPSNLQNVTTINLLILILCRGETTADKINDLGIIKLNLVKLDTELFHFQRFYQNKTVVIQLLVKINDLGIIKLNLVKLDTEIFISTFNF